MHLPLGQAMRSNAKQCNPMSFCCTGYSSVLCIICGPKSFWRQIWTFCERLAGYMFEVSLTFGSGPSRREKSIRNTWGGRLHHKGQGNTGVITKVNVWWRLQVSSLLRTWNDISLWSRKRLGVRYFHQACHPSNSLVPLTHSYFNCTHGTNLQWTCRSPGVKPLEKMIVCKSDPGLYKLHFWNLVNVQPSVVPGVQLALVQNDLKQWQIGWGQDAILQLLRHTRQTPATCKQPLDISMSPTQVRWVNFDNLPNLVECEIDLLSPRNVESKMGFSWQFLHASTIENASWTL